MLMWLTELCIKCREPEAIYERFEVLIFLAAMKNIIVEWIIRDSGCHINLRFLYDND
jgi:hypothetical protein